MKKGLLVGLFLLAFGILFLSPGIAAQEIDTVVKANNQFAFDLYSKYRLKDGNVFYSPYSISSALAMTYEGSKGKTADEIQSVFHFPQDESMRRSSFLKIYQQINKQDKSYSLSASNESVFNFPQDESMRRSSFLKIDQQINKQDKSYSLSTANALWAHVDYKFLPDYVGLVEQFYGGNTTNLDFATQTEPSRLTINSWVEAQTNQKIKNFIPLGALDSTTRLVITNAVYFKGMWLRAFDKTLTQYADFRIDASVTIKTPMMYFYSNKTKFKYAETADLQILELPYKGDKLSMVVLLPKTDDLKSVEGSLTYESLSTLMNTVDNENVRIYLPRFKFETSYSMKDDLAGLGMPTAFEKGVADFSGMTGKPDLFIGAIIHKAFVDVNEEGTEATAAIAVRMDLFTASRAGEPDPIKIFKADHPFIFLIKENETGTILFIGRVSDPRNK